jgi:hypothetical protein
MSKENQKCSSTDCDKESCQGCEKNPESFLENTHELNQSKK